MADVSERLPAPVRKRRRPALACIQCRRRKMKCDRGEPCGPCARTRNSLTCSYANQQPNVSRSQSETQSSGSPIGQAQCGPREFNSHATSRDQRYQDEHDAEIGLLTSAAEDKVLRDVQQRLQHLESLLGNFERQNILTASMRSSGEQNSLRNVQERLLGLEEGLTDHHARNLTAHSLPASAVPPMFIAGPSIPAVPPRLRVAPNKTKLFGKSHWLHAAENLKTGKFDAKEVELVVSNGQAELKTMVKDCRNLRQAVKAARSVKLDDPVADLLSTIPPQSVCNDLLQHYFNTFEIIYRVIHVPTFQREYKRFWTQSQSMPHHFVMKFVLMMSIGTIFYEEDFEKYHRLAKRWIYAAQWWLMGPSEKSTLNLDGLEVYCLLIMARQINSLGFSSSVSTASLLRFAMSMGLHRSPKLFPALSVFQTEIRLRLWTTIVELTVQSCLDSGIPLLLDLKDFDSYAPSNVNDIDIDSLSKDIPKLQPSETHTDSSISNLLRRSLPTRIAALRELNSISKVESYEIVLKLSAELRTACREVTAFFVSQASSGNGVLKPAEFHKIYLDMALRRYILFLHRPFMIRARTDPQFYLSRKTCLESSMIIASYAKHLQLPSHNPDYLARIMMNGTGWLKGSLSLDVITSLGLEMIMQLEEEMGFLITSHPRTADPLDEMAEAGRAPVIAILEHIFNQSLHVVALGNARLKRYNFLSAILSQIRAMKSGQSPEQSISEGLVESLKQCYDALRTSEGGRMLTQNPNDVLLDENELWTPAATDPLGEYNLDSLVSEFCHLNQFASCTDLQKSPSMFLDYPNWLAFPVLSTDEVPHGDLFDQN